VGGCFFAVLISHIKSFPLEYTQGIVVFTGEKGRVEKALNLYEEGWGSFLHISGKQKQKTITPYISHDDALNTQENVDLTLRWIRKHGLRSVRLVTSDYHMPRCLALASSVWPTTIIPHPLHLDLNGANRISKIIKEYNKWLWVKIKSFV